MYRLTLHLRYSNKDNRWHLYADTRHWRSFDRKADGESIGRERGSLEYRQGGEARLTVQLRHGDSSTVQAKPRLIPQREILS